MKNLLLTCLVVLLLIESFLLVPCSGERNRRWENFVGRSSKCFASVFSSIEKRLHTQWGKREQTDSEELYQRILRALVQSARAKQRQNENFVPDQSGSIQRQSFDIRCFSTFLSDENEIFQEILKNRNSWRNAEWHRVEEKLSFSFFLQRSFLRRSEWNKNKFSELEQKRRKKSQIENFYFSFREKSSRNFRNSKKNKKKLFLGFLFVFF